MTDLELFVMGEHDGDFAGDPKLADEARFEALLRDAAAAATFCVACDDLVRGERCDACGAAVKPGGYVALRVLVGNAHGRMYVAHDADGKRVALKELAFVQQPSLHAIAAFEREAKLLRALEHAAIPRFCASFEEGEGVHTRYYLAQELVDGQPLDRLDDHWYSEVEIVAIARQVLEVLVYLQGLSPMVIHRDIKPANLIKRADGSIAVVDFGAAHVQGATAGSTTIGTFGYMPIEQLAGIVDATTDVYALGTSLIHLLTRQEPWKVTQLVGTLNVSAKLRGWLGKIVAQDPKHRFANAKDALAALDAKAEVATPTQRRPRWPLIVAAAAIVTGGGTFATVRALSHHATPKPPADAGMIAPMVIDAGMPMHVMPHLPPMPPEARYHNDKRIDLHYAVVPGDKDPKGRLTSVIDQVAKECGLDVITPDSVGGFTFVDLDKVPCDQAFESILQSTGLWYGYEPDGNVAFVSSRAKLDAERADAAARRHIVAELGIDDTLPAGALVDFDDHLFTDSGKELGLRDAISRLAAAGKVNVIIPDNIGGFVGVVATKAPWHHVLQAVLKANGLWYRYKPEGRILVIESRAKMDAEDADELARRHMH